MSTYYIRDAIPIRAAAKTLGCDGSLVMKLVNCGFLEGYKDGNATKIFFIAFPPISVGTPLLARPQLTSRLATYSRSQDFSIPSPTPSEADFSGSPNIVICLDEVKTL